MTSDIRLHEKLCPVYGKIRDVMNERVARVAENSTMIEVAQLLVLTQASDIAVVDSAGRLVGVVSEGDLIRAAMPDFAEVVKVRGSLADAFRFFLDCGRGLARQSIARSIIPTPITVGPDDEILKAATVMIEKNIRRLPVVDGDLFVGTVSRADVCWGLMSKGSEWVQG
jgi:CBS domain-containing protein